MEVKNSPNGNAKHCILMGTTAHSSLRLRRNWGHSTKQKHFLFCAIMISHSHIPSLKKLLLCFIATWNSSRVCIRSLIRMQIRSWTIWESLKIISHKMQRQHTAKRHSNFFNHSEKTVQRQTFFWWTSEIIRAKHKPFWRSLITPGRKQVLFCHPLKIMLKE